MLRLSEYASIQVQAMQTKDKEAEMNTNQRKTFVSKVEVFVMTLLIAFTAPAYLGSHVFGALRALAAQNTQNSVYWVHVETGYLALRTGKAYDYSNEIGKLYTGEMVQVTDSSDPNYWYVYAPSLGMYGYVNRDYLDTSEPTQDASAAGVPMTVSVSSGYLALRTAKAYDAANEIGKLYSGDTVYVKDITDHDYWWVYAPGLSLEGYVNKDYLLGGSTYTYSLGTWTVSVPTGYLALRTAKAYDASNEIGKLYTGNTVQVIDASDDSYWYVYAPSLNLYGYVNENYLY